MNVGLTGDIGSGKSTTLALFADQGFVTYSADQIVHDLFRSNQTLRDSIVEAFGETVLTSEGAIDRKKLGEIVFHAADKRLRLEGIVHPMVRQVWEEGIKNAGKRDVIVEIPLLFEKNLEKHFDYSVTLFTSLDEKFKRLRERNLDEAAVRARLSSQLDQDSKANRSDFLILNNGSLDFLRRQILGCISQMQARAQ